MPQPHTSRRRLLLRSARGLCQMGGWGVGGGWRGLAALGGSGALALGPCGGAGAQVSGTSGLSARVPPVAPIVPAAQAATPATQALRPQPPVAGEPLVLAVAPQLPSAGGGAAYEALRRYLARLNPQRRPQLLLPASARGFYGLLQRGDCDIALAPAHLARLAQADGPLLPVLVAEPRLDALLVSAVDSGLAGPQGLRRNAVLATPGPSALITLHGLQWLGDMGLVQGKDFQLRPLRTDLGLARAVLAGDATAAWLTSAEFRALPVDERARLRIVATFARLPNLVVMAHPRLGMEGLLRLKQQLKALWSDPDAGASLARSTGLTGLAEPDDSAWRELEPFLAPTRQALGLSA